MAAVRFIGSIPAYVPGECIEIYFEYMKHILSFNDWVEDHKKKLFLLTAIGLNNLKLLKGLLYPEIAEDKTYDELVMLLTDHFKPKVISKSFKIQEESLSSNVHHSVERLAKEVVIECEIQDESSMNETFEDVILEEKCLASNVSIDMDLSKLNLTVEVVNSSPSDSFESKCGDSVEYSSLSLEVVSPSDICEKCEPKNCDLVKKSSSIWEIDSPSGTKYKFDVNLNSKKFAGREKVLYLFGNELRFCKEFRVSLNVISFIWLEKI